MGLVGFPNQDLVRKLSKPAKRPVTSGVLFVVCSGFSGVPEFSQLEVTLFAGGQKTDAKWVTHMNLLCQMRSTTD